MKKEKITGDNEKNSEQQFSSKGNFPIILMAIAAILTACTSRVTMKKGDKPNKFSIEYKQ